jgi:S-adenosylmethionine:diacylglycerol 3-amino-3-carboxypropyl transferase
METKFKSKPAELRALPNADEVARFAAGAETRAVEPEAISVTAPATKEPKRARWEKHDKNDKPTSGINLRINAYEHELLRFLADADQRSIQQVIKRLLIPAAEQAAKEIREK